MSKILLNLIIKSIVKLKYQKITLWKVYIVINQLIIKILLSLYAIHATEVQDLYKFPVILQDRNQVLHYL